MSFMQVGSITAAVATGSITAAVAAGSITAAVAAVIPDILAKVWAKFDYSIDTCLESGGRHIEHHFLWCFIIIPIVHIMQSGVFAL